MKKIEKTKKEIIESLEGKRVVKVKPKFKHKLEMFILGWKHTRKFPDYFLLKEMKKIFKSQEYEVMIK